MYTSEQIADAMQYPKLKVKLENINELYNNLMDSAVELKHAIDVIELNKSEGAYYYIGTSDVTVYETVDSFTEAKELLTRYLSSKYRLFKSNLKDGEKLPEGICWELAPYSNPTTRRLILYVSFKSAEGEQPVGTCRRVQVGTKLTETPVYEVICKE